MVSKNGVRGRSYTSFSAGSVMVAIHNSRTVFDRNDLIKTTRTGYFSFLYKTLTCVVKKYSSL